MTNINMEAIQPAPLQERADLKTWIALISLLLAAFMNFIDVTIINVALPTLQSDFNASSTQVEWVVAGYVLFFALGLLPFGRLGDAINRRSLFLIGVLCFTIASLLCGISQSMDMLIISRILQGMSAALLMPQIVSMIHVSFPPSQRNLAFSLFGLVSGLASVSGPVLSGLLIEANFYGWGWRWIFLINIPVGILCILTSLKVLPNVESNRELKMDWGGIVLSIAAALLIIFPLIEGRSFGWPSWIFAMIGLSFIAFALFYFWERRRSKQGASQLLPVDLMRNANFLIGALMVIAFFCGIPAFFMVLALFLQLGFGLSPLESGLTTLPFPAGVLVASIASGIIGSRWPKTRLIGGFLTLISGMILLGLVVEIPLKTEQLAAPLFISGIGLGFAIAALFEGILAGVPDKDSGSGSGTLQALQQIGGALGVALLGFIFFAALEGTSPAKPEAYISAMHLSVIFEIIVFSLVAILALFLKPQRYE